MNLNKFMNNKSANNKKNNLLLFIVWPFGAFINSCLNIRNKSFHAVFLMFAFVYGYSVFIQQGDGDIVRYSQAFDLMIDANADDYLNYISNLLKPNSALTGYYKISNEQPDIYANTLMFIVTRFTENSRWFFALVSLFYFILFLKFINECLYNTNWVGSNSQKFFLVFLMVAVPFYVGVTGIRFWTALYFYMIFALKYVRTERLKYVFIASLSIAIHFTFIFPIALLFVYRILPRTKILRLLIIVFSVSIFLTGSANSVLGFINQNTESFGESKLASKAEVYTNEEYLNDRQENVSKFNWYVLLNSKLLFYILVLITILEKFKLINFFGNSYTKKIDDMHYVFFINSLITYDMGSFSRFIYIFYLLSFYRYLLFAGVSQNFDSIKKLAYLYSFPLILHVLVSLRAGFYTVDPYLILSNSLFLFFIHSDISLSELIVGH